MSSPTLRRFAAWFALVALLAVTFVPAVARAVSGADFGSVCAAEAPRGSPSDDGHSELDHCPYCALHAHLALPAGSARENAAAPAAWRALPAAFLRAPRASSVWATSQPRGPPASA